RRVVAHVRTGCGARYGNSFTECDATRKAAFLIVHGGCVSDLFSARSAKERSYGKGSALPCMNGKVRAAAKIESAVDNRKRTSKALSAVMVISVLRGCGRLLFCLIQRRFRITLCPCRLGLRCFLITQAHGSQVGKREIVISIEAGKWMLMTFAGLPACCPQVAAHQPVSIELVQSESIQIESIREQQARRGHQGGKKPH